MEKIKLKNILKKAKLIIVAAFLAGFSFNSTASTWPDKEITIIVPFPAGGTVDRIARAFAQDLPAVVGKPVIVKNVPGANNIVAINELLRSDPDYTFIMGLGSMVYTSIANNNELYKELTPNMIIGSSKVALFKNKNSNTKDFIAKVYGTQPVLVTSGDTMDNGQMWLLSMDKVNLQMVPFKGAPDMIKSVMQGEPEWGSCSIFCLWGFLKNEQVDVAFINGQERSKFLPAVPTANELGLKPQSYNFDTIYLLASSKKISHEAADKMNSALRQVGNTNSQIQNFGKTGLDLRLTSIKESNIIWAEQEKMAKFYFKKN